MEFDCNKGDPYIKQSYRKLTGKPPSPSDTDSTPRAGKIGDSSQAQGEAGSFTPAPITESTGPQETYHNHYLHSLAGHTSLTFTLPRLEHDETQGLHRGNRLRGHAPGESGGDDEKQQSPGLGGCL